MQTDQALLRPPKRLAKAWGPGISPWGNAKALEIGIRYQAVASDR